MNNYIKEIEKYASDFNIPIMLPDGIDYLCKYIKNNNINNILEIGTAIGYSAIRMAMVNNNIKITTIERDKARYEQALINIKKMNLQDRIKVIYGDALDTEIEGFYDLIFIDASKGGSIKFFNKYKHNLTNTGTIITDNLAFHGLVDNPNLAITKNQKGLVKRIKEFINFLDNNKEYQTKYIEVGDRISISKKIN